MLSATNLDGTAFNTRRRTAQCTSSEDATCQSDAVAPDVTDTSSTTPKSLTVDRLEALLQMQKMDPFCKHISKCLSKEKAPKHEANLFLRVKGLLYKHVTNSHQRFLALVIPKAWKYTVLVSHMDLLCNKMSVLLERHKQGYQEINCLICTLPQRKSKGSSLPSTDYRNSRMPLWHDSHWCGHRMWNFQFRQQTHPHHNRSPHRMAKIFSHTWQISRYHIIHIHKPVPSSPYVPQKHTVR